MMDRQGVFSLNTGRIWARVAIGGVCLALLMVRPVRLEAQQTAINGTVLDPAGKPMADANVSVRNEAVGTISKTASDNEGHFSATALTPGAYTVEISAPGFALFHVASVQVAGNATVDLPVRLVVASVAQVVTVEGFVPLAAQVAPSGNTLDASSAKTEISGAFIRNFSSPVSDFAEVVNFSPGTVSINPNGIGLGQGATYFRGFADGQYTITFDGIPFEDTNTPTHHSWANFPSKWIGSTDFDRSPGQASNFGQTNFGGSINLLSQDLQASPDIRGSVSYGSLQHSPGGTGL